MLKTKIILYKKWNLQKNNTKYNMLKRRKYDFQYVLSTAIKEKF